MPDFLRGLSGRVVAVLLALVAAGVSVTIVDNGPDHGPDKPRRSAKVHIGPETRVDNADSDAKPNDVVELTPKAQDVARHFIEHPGDLAKDKPGAPPLAGLGHQVAEGVIPFPWASDEIAGCRTRFLKVNFSARGVAPEKVVLLELHYTAGPDIPNSRADVDGLTAFGNKASSRVSWHFNVDKDGECDYNVPLRSKAWTIAGLNSYTINVEVAGKGEAPYLRPAGYRQLARIIHQVRQAYPGIKLRLGATDGHCHPTLGGLDSHYRGGPCSGGHSDIKPHDLQKVIARIAAATKALYPDHSALDRAKRSHRIVHAKIAKRCRGAHRHDHGCSLLFRRNGALHAKYGKALAG